MPKVHVPDEDVCCAYREKLRKKKEASSTRKKGKNATGCCAGKRLTCDEISKITAEPSTSLSCSGIKKKKRRRLKKQVNPCCFDHLFTKIKPTLSEREKYLNMIHIICVLESEELIRMKAIQKVRDQLKESEEIEECEIQVDNNDTNLEKTSSTAKSLNTEASGEEDQKQNTVQEKASEQVAKNRNSGKKMKIPAGSSVSENESECSSICSFDSKIDLTGLHLTKKDVEQIEKDREEILKQQKCEEPQD